MLERQEKTALFILVCVVVVILTAHLLFDAFAMPLVAAPYSADVPDGTLVVLDGSIEEIRKTATGGHLILTVNGTTVFLPDNVAAALELHENGSVMLYGTVETYRGKREIVVNSPGDLQVHR
jgi:DNA/RNA endonuclease YhcR with UshA esterase domain